MAWRILFIVLAGTATLRLLPGLLLRLALALPANRVHGAVRSARRSARFEGPFLPGRHAYGLQLSRTKLLVISSSLLILGMLATAVLLRWHAAALTLLLH